MKAFLFALLLIPAFLPADTVEVKGGSPLQGKAVRYGGFWVVATDADRFRILDAFGVSSVSPDPPSPLRIFLDLPPAGEGEGEKPDFKKIRVFANAKAMARGLLSMGAAGGCKSESLARIHSALAELMKEEGVEAEVFSTVSHLSDEGRVALALEALKDAKPGKMEERLVELALGSSSTKVRLLAAEELKRRVGVTPKAVRRCLTRKESSPRDTCAAADVVGVIRDPGGLSALSEAIETRGVDKVLPPRIPFWTGPTELKEEVAAHLPDGRHPELTGHVRWLDEEAPPLLQVRAVILPHLLAVLHAASGKDFKNVDEVRDFREGLGR